MSDLPVTPALVTSEISQTTAKDRRGYWRAVRRKFGRDPIAVRVNNTTVALRRREAMAILVI